jgi:hypothetical protein
MVWNRDIFTYLLTLLLHVQITHNGGHYRSDVRTDRVGYKGYSELQ